MNIARGPVAIHGISLIFFLRLEGVTEEISPSREGLKEHLRSFRQTEVSKS